MIVVLYGTDEFSIDEEAQRLAAEEMPPDMADLNTTRLGAEATVEDVRAAAATVPFLAPHRVARVDGLLAQLTQPARRVSGARSGRSSKGRAATRAVDALAELLPSVPAEARLIFAEPLPADRSSRRRPAPAFLRGSLGKALKQHATVKEFSLPQGPGLVRWLRERARRLGSSIMPDAADLLAQVSDGDLRSLDQEVHKLLTYAGPGRSVNAEDVRLLVPAAAQTDVFAFVDALATGQQRQALGQVTRFSAQGERPEYLVTMIARQVRLLNQAKSLARAGTPTSELPAALGEHPFVARKVAEQARRFNAEALVAMHHAVLDADLSVKTGQVDLQLALELLTVQLASYGPQDASERRTGQPRRAPKRT